MTTATAVPQDDPAAVPARVRRAAFVAAMDALRESLLLEGYTVDAIGELELLDAELRAVVAAWDGPAMVH
jgi:hypothetical protein